MDIYFLDKNLQTYAVLDTYKSLIWTERYNEVGDFEIYAPITKDLINICRIGNYVSIAKSNRLMIIEKIETKSVFDEADHIIVSGRSLESLLTRRIVWDLLTYDGSTQDLVHKIIDDAIISPTDANRQISNFSFQESTDTTITELTTEAQYVGETLYEIVAEICEKERLGFKVEFQNGDFVFSLYRGTDRSYNQTDNSYVIFSTSFENISESDYVEDYSAQKTICLVGGEGEGNQKKYANLDRGMIGIDRKETYKDASNVSSKLEGGTTLPAEDYELLLQYEAVDVLSSNHESIEFSAEYSENQNFVYKRDFFLGDIVEIEDPYGHTGRVCIKEWIISIEDGEYRQYPSFEAVIEDSEEEEE